MQHRPLCKHCFKRPAAVNYIREGIRYFRSSCASCLRKKDNKKPAIPNWKKAGYKKKIICDRCGFKSSYKEQLFVYYVDGNQNNVAWSNLKTICANCQIEVSIAGLGWSQGDLTPDF